jgi:glutamate formiminotransferase
VLRGDLLCEPNVSEGRDSEAIASFAGAIEGTPGARLVHVSADPDHNRLVLAYRGDPEAVVDASRNLAKAVFARLDMRAHAGQHPRLGSLDVVPFVPLGGLAQTAALVACRGFGEWVGSRGVPVYYYESAATRPERVALPDVRKGGFETLSDRLADPRWAPDEGPSTPHASAGAVITGVRGPLVRFNVNLGAADPTIARRIARAIRESGGGLPRVRALGLELPRRGLSQVSTNLLDYRVTSITDVFDRVSAEAARAGVAIAGSEIIGPLPRDALAGVDARVLASVSPDQILEENPE